MISPTKKMIKEKIEKILSDYKDKNKIEKFFIQNNIVMIIANISQEEKNKFDSVFTAQLYKELLPEYKQKKLANLPMIITHNTETGIKIEF